MSNETRGDSIPVNVIKMEMGLRIKLPTAKSRMPLLTLLRSRVKINTQEKEANIEFKIFDQRGAPILRISPGTIKRA